MAFRVPTFNLVINVWRSTSAFGSAPDVVAAGNLTPGGRSQLGGDLSAPTAVVSHFWPGLMRLLCPKNTDIRYLGNNAPGSDVVEAPAGSGRFYLAVWVDDVGKGYPNEYRFASLCPISSRATVMFNAGATFPQWPTPYP